MEIRYGKALPPEDDGEGGGKIDLVDLFSQLFLRSNGDVGQALEWLRRIAERQVESVAHGASALLHGL